jgi:cystathionine beta-lyase/cystathionine gamma-synthase
VAAQEREQTQQVFRQGGAVGGEYSITGTLPALDDVIAFKEGTARFDHGYYRFVTHPRLRELENELKARFKCRHCRLTESLETALLELILCLRKPGTETRIVILRGEGVPVHFSELGFLPACEREGVTVVTVELGKGAPSDFAPGATVIAVVAAAGDALPSAPELPGVRFFVVGLGAPQSCLHAGAVLSNADRVMDRLAVQMKRRGPSLSSRAAESLLKGSSTKARPDTKANTRVAEALCRLEGGHQAFLYTSGMAAITRVLDLVRRPGKSRIVAVGHLYNDTYQTLRLGPNQFLGVDEMDKLETIVGDQTAAILTETITNPLSDVPDLDELFRVARARGIPLVVDNTIATPANCNPFEHGADYVIHSTTKYLNGGNDHAGGVVIVRELSLGKGLADSRTLLDDQMSPLEAVVLERNLGTFQERMVRFNSNAVKIAAFLAGHRAVGRVYFNALPGHRSYAVARRLLRGSGSVISFVLAQNTWEGLRSFYDSRLDGIVKAPSLGSDVTLLCPYALLTHYDDTDEALAEIGLPRFLLRVSVGCEKDISPVQQSLDAALSTCLET